MKAPGLLASILLATALVIPHIAEARGGFGGRMPRMNFGGGGMHGGGMHHFNAPAHMQPRFHPAGQPPHGIHPRPPQPGPLPVPHPSGHHPHPPLPGPHPGPHPVPGPHPMPPPPRPLPPPPPPPGPYWPGYWGPAAAWGAATAIAVGTVIATLPPECVNVVVNGVSYRECGGQWFEPRYDGHTVVYIAVAAPR